MAGSKAAGGRSASTLVSHFTCSAEKNPGVLGAAGSKTWCQLQQYKGFAWFGSAPRNLRNEIFAGPTNRPRATPNIWNLFFFAWLWQLKCTKIKMKAKQVDKRWPELFQILCFSMKNNIFFCLFKVLFGFHRFSWVFPKALIVFPMCFFCFQWFPLFFQRFFWGFAWLLEEGTSSGISLGFPLRFQLKLNRKGGGASRGVSEAFLVGFLV